MTHFESIQREDTRKNELEILDFFDLESIEHHLQRRTSARSRMQVRQTYICSFLLAALELSTSLEQILEHSSSRIIDPLSSSFPPDFVQFDNGQLHLLLIHSQQSSRDDKVSDGVSSKSSQSSDENRAPQRREQSGRGLDEEGFEGGGRSGMSNESSKVFPS